jgi:hypothetical protein
MEKRWYFGLILAQMGVLEIASLALAMTVIVGARNDGYSWHSQ